MKLIINNSGGIAGTATDGYIGIDLSIDAPLDFDIARINDYRLINGVLTLPAPKRHITRLSFRNRFSPAEKVAIEIAALDNPTAPMAQRTQAAALRASQADLSVTTMVDLDRAETRAGVQMLEAAGLLAKGRSAEILDAQVQPHEVYYG